MDNKTFKNKVWVSWKTPWYIWIVTAASGMFMVLNLIVFAMEGVSFFDVMLTLTALFIFAVSVSYIRKNGKYVETRAVLYFSKGGLCLDYPELKDPSIRSWCSDPNANSHEALYDKDLGTIILKGMMDMNGRARNVVIYDTAPLDEIMEFLKAGGITVEEKEKRQRKAPPQTSDRHRNVMEGDYVSVSGRVLADLLWAMTKETKRRFLDGTLIVSQEILFEYGRDSGVHIAGIRYDKKAAKEAGETDFCSKYMTVYMEKRVFGDSEDFYENASLNGVPLRNISDGIYIARDEYEHYTRKELD